MDENALWNQYYRDSGINEVEFVEAWRAICKMVKIDAKKLRPDDRISDFLKARSWYVVGDEWCDFLATISHRAHLMGRRIEGSEMKTVDDFVRAIVQLGREAAKVRVEHLASTKRVGS
jgi:hypothetical protein